MGNIFGSAQLIKCVLSLGCKLNRANSSHEIFDIPKNVKSVVDSERPYIVIQTGRKQFDRHSCSRYLSQLKAKGFKKEDIEKYL
jgi:hypothetical protein